MALVCGNLVGLLIQRHFICERSDSEVLIHGLVEALHVLLWRDHSGLLLRARHDPRHLHPVLDVLVPCVLPDVVNDAHNQALLHAQTMSDVACSTVELIIALDRENCRTRNAAQQAGKGKRSMKRTLVRSIPRSSE